MAGPTHHFPGIVEREPAGPQLGEKGHELRERIIVLTTCSHPSAKCAR